MGGEGHEQYMRMLKLRWKSSEATNFHRNVSFWLVLVTYGNIDNRLRV